ncbi:MAG: dihydroorotate dehydrogenase, partial [Candidatus Atribacteria bacterium]|nr:dihydroorotate dehydrogenase [Candidatus Atribacteria bacterium]
IELNISCPNVKEGGMAFGTSLSSAAEVTKLVREVYKKTLIVKLSPNVTDIKEIACSAEEAGADAISLINTLAGMVIDIDSARPKLANIHGGLSGPAIKPVALWMVWQVYQTVKIPIIGIGGIMRAEDAIEFIIAGARAVQIGTANLVNPEAPIEIIEGIKEYLIRKQKNDINELVGSMIV